MLVGQVSFHSFDLGISKLSTLKTTATMCRDARVSAAKQELRMSCCLWQLTRLIYDNAADSDPQLEDLAAMCIDVKSPPRHKWR